MLLLSRFLLGSEENPDAVRDNSQRESISTSDNHDNSSNSKRHSSASDDGWRASIARIPGVPYLRERALALLQLMKGTPRHPICPHRHGCLHYVVTGLLKMFGVGLLAQSTIKLMSSMSLLRRRPSQVLRSLVSMHNMGLGAFLGLYCALFRAVNCALRWLRGEDSAAHGFVGGLAAGAAMIFYKSITVSLYSCAKLMEILYFKGIESGHLPHIPWADVLIYAFSTAFVFHAAVFEPHALRSAYWKFLLRVTEGKFAGMNRRLLDGFGTKSSQLYPNYWPQYDTRFTQLSPNTDLSSLYR
ncbi:hypothetical protein C0Q70_11453 [Pomacea canaliculata]|uniref:Transmembrane protein 135 N-terminal domain-containing protein n=1 Tax=Pomacea canaliculata TaxID=400727 RepID=A0A2T7P617_POMCA|nr:hypothetical protein C0Q70_11453 [Pomacea canaliculata]